MNSLNILTVNRSQLLQICVPVAEKTRMGRAQHLCLWLSWAALAVFSLIELVLNDGAITPLGKLFDFSLLLFFLFCLLNMLVLKVRRAHDCDYTGWWLLLLFIPIIGELFLLALFLLPGTLGENRFGAIPTAYTWHGYALFSAPFLILLLMGLLSEPNGFERLIECLSLI